MLNDAVRPPNSAECKEPAVLKGLMNAFSDTPILHSVQQPSTEGASRTRFDWEGLHIAVDAAKGEGPGYTSPSILFSKEVIDYEDRRFMKALLPKYRPLEIDFATVGDRVGSVVGQDSWLQWSRDKKEVPLEAVAARCRTLRVESNAPWVGWFCRSVEQWALLRHNLTKRARATEPANYTFEHNLCAEPLRDAFLHCDLLLCWTKRPMASDPDFDPTAKHSAEFPSPKYEWANAFVLGSSGVNVFFLKSSLGCVRIQSQRDVDRAKVVMAAACGAWDAMQNVPPHKRSLGLGCIGAHLYEEDKLGEFSLDVYYVGYNAFHCCFECQCLASYPLVTDVSSASNLTDAIHALVTMGAIAWFAREQDLRWASALESDSPGKVPTEDRREIKQDRLERNCREHNVDLVVPEYAFVRAGESDLPSVLNAVGNTIRVDAASVQKGSFSAVWKGTATSDESPVALKVHSRGHHLCEVNALWTLQDVPGVQQIRASYVVSTSRMVLITDLLECISYDTLRQNDADVLQFAQSVCEIVAAIHEKRVFHHNIRPAAFMRKGTSYVMTDFSRSQVGHARLPYPRCASGVLFVDAPVVSDEQCDCVGLGTVLGWILQIDGFEYPATLYEKAVRSAWDVKGESPCRTEVLYLVRQLMSGRVSVADLL